MIAHRPQLPEQPLKVVTAEFEGYPCRLALGPGGEDHVFADDFADGIGSDMNSSVKALHNKLSVVKPVLLDGEVVHVRLITARNIYYLCQLNPSPRFDAFRQRVADILDQVHRTGSYVAPGAARPPVPDEFARDPIIALRMRQLAMEELARQADAKSDRALAVAKEAHQIAIGEDGFRTLSEHAARKGFSPPNAILKQEGIDLSDRLRRAGRGHLIHPVKRDPGAHNSHPANAYDVSVLDREWWPDFARRQRYAS
jgi:hypothetical protein